MVQRTLAAIALATIVAAPHDARAQAPPRYLAGMSGALQTANVGFRDHLRFPLNAEDADLNADYEVGTGRVFDAELNERVWRALVVGVNVSYFEKHGRVGVDARLPHPLFFDRARTVAGEGQGIRRSEVGVHVRAGWVVPLSDRIDVVVSGGPSYITVRQALVEAISFSETFPFNSAAFGGVTTRQADKGGFGFNAGADVAFWLHRRIGIGSGLRYTRATLELDPVEGGNRLDVKAGGLQVSGGLRFRF